MQDTNSILDDIILISEIAADLKEKDILSGLTELRDKIVSGWFYLVVIGLFKRGKSTLINALIGQEIAPVDVTPLTSVITFFEYGKRTSVEVTFLNGNTESIDLNIIGQYVSEELNPKNRKKVKFVRIFTSASILQQLTLVDTPGIGSLFENNTDVTVDFIPRIDAALFVLSADLPISKADEEFLKKVMETIPNLLFVMNKTDLLSKPELKKMTEYNKNMLQKFFNSKENEVNLINVSAKEYLNHRNKSKSQANSTGNIKNLKEEIYKQITSEKDQLLVENSARRLLVLSDQLDTLITLRMDSLKMPLVKLEEKRDSLQSSIDFFISGKDDFETVVKNRINQLQQMVTNKTEKERQVLEARFHELFLEKADQTWNQILKTDTETFNQELVKEITSNFEALKKNLEESVKKEFHDILVQYSQQSQSFLNQIADRIQEILGINIKTLITTFDLDVYTGFYFKKEPTYYIPSIKSSFFYRLLPDSIVKKRILKQMHTNCIELINPNAGRIQSNINYKIQESFRKFKHYFDEVVFNLLQNLKEIIEESISSKRDYDDSISDKIAVMKKQKLMAKKVRSKYSVTNEQNG